MSDDAVKALNARIEQLSAENADLKAEAKSRRIAGKKSAAEVDRLTRENGDLVKDRDSWKAKADASHPDLVKKVGELQAVIRDGKHRSAFDKAAEAAGVDPKAVADLWQLSGYKAEAEEPDPKAIDAAIAGAKESRPYLFRAAQADPAAPPAGPAKPVLTLPVDTSRGGGSATAAAFKVTKANLQDLTWMQQNATKMREARDAGTLAFE